MNRELISVIIPTYNRAEMLKEAMQSILNQTYQNFEILVIDDGSVDNTKEIVQSYKDKRINYIWQEHSGLSPRARNTGIKIAKGMYIALLDSDDIWLPRKLEEQLKAFEENQDILVVATNSVYFSDGLNYINIFSFKKNRIITFRETLRMCIINNSSVLIKKDVIEAIGYKDENCRLMSDYDYWLRLLKYKDKSIMILKNVLVKTRLHKSNTFRRNSDFLENYRTWVYIYNKHKDYDQNYIESNLKWRLHRHYFFNIERLVLQKKIKLYPFLKNEHIKFNEKLLVILKYVGFAYLNKKNYFLKLLKDIFHFYIFRLIKPEDGFKV